jgi:hypothetical protein
MRRDPLSGVAIETEKKPPPLGVVVHSAIAPTYRRTCGIAKHVLARKGGVLYFWNLEELSERIMAFIEHYDRSAKPIEWSYTVAQMEEKFGTE